MTRTPDGTSATIVNNVKRIKARRGLTTVQLAVDMNAAGHPTKVHTLSNLFSKHGREVRADELVAFAQALNLRLDTLVIDVCEHCDASPPPSMICAMCGADNFDHDAFMADLEAAAASHDLAEQAKESIAQQS